MLSYSISQCMNNELNNLTLTTMVMCEFQYENKNKK